MPLAVGSSLDLAMPIHNPYLASSTNLQNLEPSPALKPLFLVPFSRDKSFIDRVDVFTKVDEQMKWNRRVALSGIDGIGSVVPNDDYG